MQSRYSTTAYIELTEFRWIPTACNDGVLAAFYFHSREQRFSKDWGTWLSQQLLVIIWFFSSCNKITNVVLLCDRRLFHRRPAATGNALSPTVDRRVRRTSRDTDQAERSRRLARVSVGRRSSSHIGTLMAPDHEGVKNKEMVLTDFTDLCQWFVSLIRFVLFEVGDLI